MPTLVIDIETVGEEFEALDTVTKESLTASAQRGAASEEEASRRLKNVAQELVFSPLTGYIVVIGMLDVDRDKSVVYFQSPGKEQQEFEEDGVTYKPKGERDMLADFWQGAKNYTEFVTFNGRGFDVPYLLLRSAIHRVRPTKNLMANRYLASQPYNAKHVDLAEELSFYGAARRKSLHLHCRAFGITSPKEEGIAGEDVGKLFAAGNYNDIARYNARDIRATKELYQYWNDYLRFS